MNILKYAIQMEKDGEAYYTKQAELSKGKSLYTVCMMLAKEEKKHAEILNRKLNNLPYELQESQIHTEVKSIFGEMDNLKNEIKELPSQLDFYKFALEKEQKSIDLYKGSLSKSQNDKEKALFDFLIKQEIEHFEIIDELVKLLTHAEQWVESAEFGTREDY